MDVLARLKTVFKPEGGVITAGFLARFPTARATLLMTTSDKAASWADAGRPVHTAVLAGADPIIMLTAPIPATRKAPARSGRSWTRSAPSRSARRSRRCAGLAGRPGADPEGLNPNGGAIALGHPLGGSGARLMTTLVHHMRDNGIRYGLQTMCEGGGQANATILELL